MNKNIREIIIAGLQKLIDKLNADLVILQQAIADLEALKKKFSEDGSNEAAFVRFYFNGMEIKNMFAQVTKALPVASVQFFDKSPAKNPAKVDGVPAWNVTDSTLGELVVAADGLSAEFKPNGTLGKFKFQCKADADMGEGIVEIFGESEEIELIAGDAEIVEIKLA